jgi:serine phosphatase RsbU (regulator of sigma subunit)
MVSEQLSDDFTRTASFATAFHARLNSSEHTLEYVDAGHGLAFLRQPDGTTVHLATADMPLGVGTHWGAVKIALDPGAMLVVCSDGLLDIITDDSNSAALADLIGRYDKPAPFARAVRTWVRDTVPMDDVTVIAIRRDAS